MQKDEENQCLDKVFGEIADAAFCIVADGIHRGSYMSAHILLNLLNELGKKMRCKALLNILSVFPNEFNKFSNTGAQMQDSIYHMTLKWHFISKFCNKTSQFCHSKTRRFYGRQRIKLQRNLHI